MHRLIVAATAAIFLAALPARGEETPPSLESCASAYGACVETCGTSQDSEAARAGCVARCAAGRASCEAEAGYAQARPWLQEQVDKLEDFLRGFRGEPEAGAPAADEEKEGSYKDL